MRKEEKTLLPLMFHLQMKIREVSNVHEIRNVIAPFVEVLAKVMLKKDITYWADIKVNPSKTVRVEYLL